MEIIMGFAHNQSKNMNTKIAIISLIVWLITFVWSLLEYQGQQNPVKEYEEYGTYFVE